MDDLLREFLEEANETLVQLDQQFIELEQNPNDLEIVKVIFRVMHTLKGTAGFLGFSRLESVTHCAETLMDKVRNSEIPVSPDLVSLVLKASDAIKEIIEGIEQSQAEQPGDNSELIAELKAFASGKPVQKLTNQKQDTNLNKTPDLDEPIDFDPIPADYAEENKADINKTPDLDEPIDFDPIPADYAEEVSQHPTTPVDIAEEKKQAAEKVLKNLEKSDAKGKDSGQGIRVSLDVLENLMQLVGELVLTRNQIVQLRRNSKDINSTFGNSLQRLNIITTELQEGVMKTRMQPIGNAWAKFPRVIRDLAKELGKKIDLKMIGEETELDRQMLEALKDPLVHMVRNSADHGVEMPADRIKAGKSDVGTVTLNAYHEGGHIIIKISDDGKGLNLEAIKKKAIERGLVTASEIINMSERQIYQFILQPGFSTAEKLTAISGRGVGMDVVMSSIEKIGGMLEIDSKSGKGSEFLIKLPLTLAIMPVLIVDVAAQTFAIPQIRVSEIVKIEKDEDKNKRLGKDSSKLNKLEVINGSPVLRLRGAILPLISMADSLRIERPSDSNPLEIENFIVVCEMGSSFFGILVDKVFHTEEIVVKQKSTLIKDLDVYSGSTILGDGSVILIIDPNGVLRNSGINSLSDAKRDEVEEKVFDDEEINFLMFATNDKTPKAIPLEVVSRLEEVDYSKIEISGGKKLVQYRGGNLMQLISIDEDNEIPNDGIRDTIVFADRGRVLGIYVSNIIDIVRQKMEIRSVSTKIGILGSMVMKGQATDIVDISYFISREFSDWLGHVEANKIEGTQKAEPKKHVLLVDDSAFFRKFMRPVILAAGYRVSTCEDGLEGLNMLKEHGGEFDIVISDIDMPRMNGVEFVKAAKADGNIKPLPFIALTSHEEGDFSEDIKEMGFEALVTKADRNKVISLITEILKERKLA